MKRFAWLAVPLLTILAACAEGDTVDGGAGGAGGSGSGGNPSSTTAQTTAATTVATTAATTGSGGDGGAGGDMTTTSTSTGQVCDFSTSDVCATADPLMALAADKDQTPVTAMGLGEAWFVIHMEEQDSNIFGEDLSYRVSLTSPAGVAYALQVQESAQNAAAPSCTATPKNGTGAPSTVSASWGDDQGFGGEDDSVWLVIHITHVSGELCGQSDKWQLKVEGHI